MDILVWLRNNLPDVSLHAPKDVQRDVQRRVLAAPPPTERPLQLKLDATFSGLDTLALGA
jgi:hypothetical protein